VLAFEEGRCSSSAIIVDSKGERLIVGARDTNMPSGTSWLPLERIAGAAAVVADMRWLEAVRVVFARARREGVPTVLDADLGAREALGEILALTDYAIFSELALRDFMPGGSVEARVRRVLSYGPRHAGVTLGAEGYLWADREGGGGRCSGFPVDVVDTTGAGDVFHGAFTLALVEGAPVARCAAIACAAAALKCTRLGSRAGLPTRAELETFLAERI
jgi:sulfofructose kinase